MTGISAGLATAEPLVGELVYHDGHRDFLITKRGTISRDGAKPTHLVQFENELQRVSCLLRDLVYSEMRGVWYLPGRVFPRAVRNDQRASELDPLEIEARFMGTYNG